MFLYSVHAFILEISLKTLYKTLNSCYFYISITFILPHPERNNAMMKKILGLLAALLMIPAIPATATEVLQDNNVDYTFDCIDGGQISTQSSGKPKLLIFFRTTCSHCQNTLKDISSSEWIKTGETEVCAIESDYNHSEDEVKSFQATYCPEGTIRFAFGGNNGFMAGRAYYAIAGTPNSSSIPTPLIAMIDVDNKVRQVTTGAITADQVESYLPSLGGNGGDSQNPGQTPDTGETEKPGTIPDTGSDENSSNNSDKENEASVACNHVWESVVINDATATSDALWADQCTKCGVIVKYEAVPNSAFSTFLRETAKKIINAKEQEVVINTQIWTSFNRTVFEAIQSRPDVTVTVNFVYKGEEYTVCIPAGTDVNLLMDENGFGGFLYINKVLNTPS